MPRDIQNISLPFPGETLPRRYIVGPENSLLSGAIGALLSDEVCPFSPLLLFGPHGVGKSHLLEGLVEELSRRRPRAKVISGAALDLARSFATAIREGQASRFQAALRECAILGIDGLEGLSGRRGIQHELASAMDQIAARGGRVVFTSHAAPGVIPELSAGLRSRLMAGLAVPIVPPEQRTRYAILEDLAAEREIAIDGPALDRLSQQLTTAPALFGALSALCQKRGADARSTEAPKAESASPRAVAWDSRESSPDESEPLVIDCEAVDGFVRRGELRRPVELQVLAAAAARHFGQPQKALRSPSRRRSVVQARNVAIYVARHSGKYSLQRIGRYFGGRDHTTVLHACRTVESALPSDPTLREAVEVVQRKAL